MKLSKFALMLNIHESYAVGLRTREGGAGCLKREMWKYVCKAVPSCLRCNWERKDDFFFYLSLKHREWVPLIQPFLQWGAVSLCYLFGDQLPPSLATDDRTTAPALEQHLPTDYPLCLPNTWQTNFQRLHCRLVMLEYPSWDCESLRKVLGFYCVCILHWLGLNKGK